MDTQPWWRRRARLMVDGFFCSSAAGIERMGDKDSGWVIQMRAPRDVVYCAGVGKGMSFEIALAGRASRPVVVVDPSPTGVATVEATGAIENLEFHAVGMAAVTGTVMFSVPRDPGEGSYSVAQDDLEQVSFTCWSLKTMMEQRGDVGIDLLKMDIEGFEYDILDGMVADGIPVRQICVEFHPWLQPGRTAGMLLKLYKAGYRIIYKHHGDYTFLLK